MRTIKVTIMYFSFRKVCDTLLQYIQTLHDLAIKEPQRATKIRNASPLSVCTFPVKKDHLSDVNLT